jgi:hypothetical protein
MFPLNQDHSLFQTSITLEQINQGGSNSPNPYINSNARLSIRAVPVLTNTLLGPDIYGSISRSSRQGGHDIRIDCLFKLQG